MAHDLQDKRDVALKVMCLGEWAETEMRMQDKIIQDIQDTSHLVIYLATFLLPRPGDNRHHRVFVFPLMGPCLDRHILQKTPMAIRISAARQLQEALENLRKAGIVHRDLNERNCMWRMAPHHNLNGSAKYEALGRQLKETIPFVDPVSQKGYPPMQFCSPDSLHGKHSSFACDMWSYMVLFGVLYLGYSPFSTCFEGGLMSDIVTALGPLPEQWKGLYIHPKGRDSWYDQDKKPGHRELAGTIARYRPDTDPNEQGLLVSIMLKVFTYDPEKHLTATQLLQGPSFRALMERYGC